MFDGGRPKSCGDYSVCGPLLAMLLAAGCGDAARPTPVWHDPSTGMRFQRIEAGRYSRGSPETEWRREAQERQHEVSISRPFYLGQFEVTQAQWQRVMHTRPWTFGACGANCPVEGVTWYDAQAFVTRLGETSAGERFRLPTEAEWEYACRAGTATPFATGRTLRPAQARFNEAFPYDDDEPVGLSPTGPVRVGAHPPNAWGLFDMHGNVWEWCLDDVCAYPDDGVTDPVGRCDSGLKIIRGGSWRFGADSARCALRYTHRPQDRGFSLGFRVVREVPAQAAGPGAQGLP